MKNHTVELSSICRDAASTTKLIKKLSVGNPHTSAAGFQKLPTLFHSWVEEQITAFIKQANVVTSPSPVPTPEPAVIVEIPASVPSTASAEAGNEEDGLGELRGLTIGGVKIGVKAKQQKKRMKPSLMAEKPNLNFVQGNINSLDNSKELVDIRAELKQVTAKAPSVVSVGGITSGSQSTDTDLGTSVKLSSAPALTATASAAPPPAVSKPAATVSKVCAACSQREDDPSAAQRMASIYATLVLCQYLPLMQAFSLLTLLLSLDPTTASDTTVCTCRPALDNAQSGTPTNLITSTVCMKAFAKSLLDQLMPVITNSGTLLATEIAESALVRLWAPELGVKMKELLNAQLSGSAPMTTHNPYSTTFKLPETFMKPFREDYDSKNEFKSQAEQGAFYERESVYDQLSNLFYCFQVINRGDLDGTAATAFFRADLLSKGAEILKLRESNYLWFAELFMQMFLYYGTTTSAAATAQVKPAAPPAPRDESAASTISSSSGAGGASAFAPTAVTLSPSRHATQSGNNMLSSSTTVGFGAANFPALGAAGATRALPVDTAKQSNLEARLGVGGEVRQPMFSPPSSSSVKFANATPRTSTSGGAHQTHAKKSITGKKYTPGGMAASPNKAPTASDVYEAASAYFPGAQQFFFRFIASMNNFRFNQSLLACIIAEITGLTASDSFASNLSMNFDSSSPSKRSPLPVFVPHDSPNTTSGVRSSGVEDAPDSYISPEAFALKVTKLKLLGRYLGVLHFCTLWIPAGSETGPLYRLAFDLGSKRDLLQVTLPLRKLLEDARRERRLSLCVPWVCEFLKMATWDPSCINLSAQLGSPARGIPYLDAFTYLRSLQYAQAMTSTAQPLTANRAYMLLEIQAFWLSIPPQFSSAIPLVPLEIITRMSRSESRELTPSIDQMLSGGDREASRMSLDDQQLAFTAVFLRHVTPGLEAHYAALRTNRLNSAAKMSMRSRAASIGGTKKLKRQTPLVMTAESIAFREALTNPQIAPPPPPQAVTSPVTTKPAFPPGISIPPVPPSEARNSTPTAVATPTKARRAISSSSASSGADVSPKLPSKSPRKIKPTAHAEAMMQGFGEDTYRSPTKVRADRTRTPSFESISPSLRAGSPRAGDVSHAPGTGNSLTNSITTSGRSSPAGTLFGGRSQRSYSDLNNSYSLRHPTGGSPVKSFLSPLKIGDYGQQQSESADTLERLEIAFWNQHSTLQHMSDFLLSQTFQACTAHVKERVGAAVRELLSNIASLRSEPDNHRYEDQLEVHMRHALHDAVTEGEAFIDDFFAKFTQSVLPQMCQLYPVNTRVVKMAIYFMNRHLQAQRAPLCGYLKAYCSRKLQELCDLSTKQHHKLTAETAAAAATASAAASIAADPLSDPEKTFVHPPMTQPEVRLAGLNVDRVLQALALHFRFATSNPSDAAGTTYSFLSEPSTCTIAPITVDLTNGIAFRNSVAQLLGELLEFAALVGQCLGQLASIADVRGHNSALIVVNELWTVRFQRNCAVKCVQAANAAAVEAIASGLSHILTSLPTARRAEYSGKLSADVAKFVTSLTPYLMYLDQSVTADAAAGRPSDILLAILDAKLLPMDMLCRALSLASRAKTGVYYETCRGLAGMKGTLTRQTLRFVGRLLQHRYGIEIAPSEEGEWYEDSSTRLSLKSSVDACLSSLITALLVSL